VSRPHSEYSLPRRFAPKWDAHCLDTCPEAVEKLHLTVPSFLKLRTELPAEGRFANPLRTSHGNEEPTLTRHFHSSRAASGLDMVTLLLHVESGVW
jgi:hypothetical protein